MFSRITDSPASAVPRSRTRSAGWVPDAGERHQDVDGVTTISAAMIARGMVFCGFLTSSPAVDTASRPMNEKKMVAAPRLVCLATPASMNPAKWSALNAVNAITTNISSTPSLMITMIGVDHCRLAGAADQQQRTHDDQEDGGQVDDAARVVPRRRRQRLRDLYAEQVVQQLVEIAAPADRHRRGRDAVLQQQAGRHTHGDELAERRVGVGVRGARNRYGRRHLGVADGATGRPRCPR